MTRSSNVVAVLVVLVCFLPAWADDADTMVAKLAPTRIAGVEPLSDNSALLWWDSVDTSADDLQLFVNGKPRGESAGESKVNARQGWLIVTGLVPRVEYRFSLLSSGAHCESEAGTEISYVHRPPWLDWAWFPPGKFEAGGQGGDEAPPHWVDLSGHLLSVTEITNGQYLIFCDSTGLPYPAEPGFPDLRDYVYRRPNYPVVNVNWHDAVLFCQWLSWQTDLPLAFDSAMNLVDPRGVRLPTEAEWEQAARGSGGTYPWGAAAPNTNLANFAETGRQTPLAVRSFAPTSCGLFDLAGNVWEWCHDWYGAYPFAANAIPNPLGKDSGTSKVVRGGSWADPVATLKSTIRGKLSPEQRMTTVGFRVARTLPAGQVKEINTNFTEGDHADTK